MLTIDKIRLYRKYGADIDGWARIGTPQEHSTMTDEEWYLIDSLVLKLSLIKSGLASPDFAQSIDEEVRQSVESEDVINELKRLV